MSRKVCRGVHLPVAGAVSCEGLGRWVAGLGALSAGVAKCSRSAMRACARPLPVGCRTGGWAGLCEDRGAAPMCTRPCLWGYDRGQGDVGSRVMLKRSAWRRQSTSDASTSTRHASKRRVRGHSSELFHVRAADTGGLILRCTSLASAHVDHELHTNYTILVLVAPAMLECVSHLSVVDCGGLGRLSAKWLDFQQQVVVLAGDIDLQRGQERVCGVVSTHVCYVVALDRTVLSC